MARLVGRRERAGAKRSRGWRWREEAALAFERRLCWDVWLRREGCVLRVVALEVVGWRGASVKGSWLGRADGIVLLKGWLVFLFSCFEMVWKELELPRD